MYSKSPRPDSQAPQRPTSQSRIRERLTSSPLKLPLENAINKALTPRDNTSQKYSTSRILVKSRLKEERDHSTSRMIARNIYKNEPEVLREKMHTETMTFLKKYFSLTVETIPVQSLIQCIIREYEHLWGTQNSHQIFDDFNYKIYEVFGECVEVRELCKRTMNDGMIGLILDIFKDIKNEEKIRTSSYLTVSRNPKIVNLKESFEEQLVQGESLENVKNIVQEFMETMYQCMESEIYNKFNVEMRRMVVKYREAERLMKKINEKINSHADVFDFQAAFNAKKKQFEETIDLQKRQIEELSRELFKEKNNCELQRRQNYKLEEQNKKLKENLERFQNAVLTKVMEPTNFVDPTLSRRVMSNTSMPEKQNVLPNQEPFKIVIDTHVIQKEGQAPQTKTYATLYGLDNLTKGAPITLENTPSTQSRIFDYPSSSSQYDPSYSRSSPISMLKRKF